MDRVGAAAVIHVDGRAGGPPYSALCCWCDLEIGDRVRRRLHHRFESHGCWCRSVVVDAVDQEVVGDAAQAVDVERAFARGVPGRQRRAGQLTPVLSSASAEYSREISGRARICSPLITCRAGWCRSRPAAARVTSTFPTADRATSGDRRGAGAHLHLHALDQRQANTAFSAVTT